MKIQIDTTNKMVKVLEPIRLSELEKILRPMLLEEYDLYTLWFTSEPIPWYNPIYIPYIPYVNPYNPRPIITYSTASTEFSYANGDVLTPSYTNENHDIHIYNFDIQEQSIT